MDNHQIARLLRKLPRTRRMFMGVFAADTVPLIRGVNEVTSYIVNLDNANQPGSHWVAIYLAPNEVPEYFDSYGEDCQNARLCSLLGEMRIYNPLRLQSFASTTCGQHSIFYILCKSFRLDMGQILDSYPGQPLANDIFVNDIVEWVFGVRLPIVHRQFLNRQIARVL